MLQTRILSFTQAISRKQLTLFNISIDFTFSIFIYALVEFPEVFKMLQSVGRVVSGAVALRIRELIVGSQNIGEARGISQQLLTDLEDVNLRLLSSRWEEVLDFHHIFLVWFDLRGTGGQ